jgi:nucleoside-diphosphate kinase
VAVVKGSGVLSKLREALVGWKAWASEDATQAADVEEWFFGQKGPGRRLPSTATLDNCTCCVIRPHAVKQGVAGKILDEIWAQGYDVSAIEMFHLDRTTANEFYEVYQGAVQCYKEMVDEATSSPCIALELRAENAVDTFRQTAGPWDVEMAKELRPNSLRAMFGTDRVRNAVHCTDLPEDGVSECSYFFNVLQVQ